MRYLQPNGTTDGGGRKATDLAERFDSQAIHSHQPHGRDAGFDPVAAASFDFDDDAADRRPHLIEVETERDPSGMFSR